MNDVYDYDEYLEPKKEKVLLDTNKSSSDKKKSNKKKINSNKSPNKKKMNEENKKNLIRSIILIVALIGLVGAFIFYKKMSTPSSEPSKPNNNSGIKDDNKEEVKKVSIIDTDSNTRPYAVMINCHNEALPQAGLNNAYIVYELMVEGGITRMMALFKDKEVNKIGSVRSARTQYLDYVYENDAIYAHAGGADDANRRLASEKINHVDVDSAYGIRDTSLKRAWEHKLFTTTTLIKKGATDKGYRLTTDVKSLLKYTPNEIDPTTYQGNKVANNVSIKYSYYRTSNYTYDISSKTYLRSMNNTKNTDLVTGEQYKVKNILVYAVNYSSYCDHGYCQYQKIDNVGSGEGFYITNGYSIPITWEKSSKNTKTTYKLKETGKELELNDGNTYIQIYPTSGKLTIN